MRHPKEDKNRGHNFPKLSLISLPEAVKWSESDSCPDMEFIQRFTSHLKLITPSGGHRSRRSLTCQGADLSETRTLTVEDRSTISSKLRSCSNFVIYDNSKSDGIKLTLNVVSNLVMWIRDDQKRFLGSVRLDLGTAYLSILDSLGRPCVIIDSRDPRTTDSNDSTLHDGSCSHVLTFRCAKSNLILATCHIFRTDLKPQSKPASVITLDFRSKDILELIDPNGTKRRLCLASLVFMELAMKRLKAERNECGTKWYL